MRWEPVFCALIGYFVGIINPSYLIGRIKGFDIREKGSGNAGGSNALIVFGKIAGVLCSLFDILKAFFAILLCRWLFPDLVQALAVCGTFCILGHIFPFYMRFRGGKGLACLGGMILAFDWRLFLIMLGGEVVLALILDYICVVAPSASVIFTVYYGIVTKDVVGVLILLLGVAAICSRHVVNLRKIRAGTEMHLSYLWHPNEEIDRVAGGASDEEKDDAFNRN